MNQATKFQGFVKVQNAQQLSAIKRKVCQIIDFQTLSPFIIS